MKTKEDHPLLVVCAGVFMWLLLELLATYTSYHVVTAICALVFVGSQIKRDSTWDD